MSKSELRLRKERKEGQQMELHDHVPMSEIVSAFGGEHKIYEALAGWIFEGHPVQIPESLSARGIKADEIWMRVCEANVRVWALCYKGKDSLPAVTVCKLCGTRSDAKVESLHEEEVGVAGVDDALERCKEVLREIVLGP